MTLDPQYVFSQIWRRGNGTQPFRVISMPSTTEVVHIRYLRTGADYFITYKDLIRSRVWDGDPIDDETGETLMTTQKEQLYIYKKADGVEAYGTIIGTRSDGKKVFEERGTSVIHVVDMRQLEKVMPYTVDVRFMEESGVSARVYSYYAKTGDLAEGDIVMLDAMTGKGLKVVQVVRIDTKSASATKWLTGLKLAGTALTAGEDDA